jgi:phage I-like protein
VRVAEFGYLVDLTSVQLSEGDNPQSWVQAVPIGTWHHPVHGEVTITPERVKRFAANVKQKVRGQDLDIDYNHKEKTDEAAGWVKDAEARADGLYLLVEWTKDAAAKIKSKAYRYFSPDFFDKWTHPGTQQSYEDVLCGGGLTNRPYLKGIMPLNLSEAFESKDLSIKLQEVGVDPKKLRKLLGLKEDATDADVTAALTEKGLTVDDLKVEPPKNDPADPPKPEDKDKKDDDTEPVQIAASEVIALAKKFSESSKDNPAAKQFADLVEAMGNSMKATEERLVKTEAALRLSEAQGKAKKLSEAFGDKYIVPPAIEEQLAKLFTEGDKVSASSVEQLFSDLAKNGLVEKGERGHSRTNSDDQKTAAKRFNEAVAEKMKESGDKLSYADAVEMVSAEKPQLFEEYRQESFAGVEN